MKSARDRDRTRLAGGPATSQAGWQRLNYTTGSPGHRQPPTTFRLRFPEGWLVLAGGSARSSQTHVLRSGMGTEFPSLLPPRINFVGASSFSQPCKQIARPRVRAASAWLQTRALWDRDCSPPAPLGRPCTVRSEGLEESPAPREGGRSLGTRGATREARGVSPPGARLAAGPRSARASPRTQVFSGNPVFAVAGRAPLQPRRCYESAESARDAPGQGWLRGSDWQPGLPSLFRHYLG